MCGVWHAVVIETRRMKPGPFVSIDGHCYVTVGWWSPVSPPKADAFITAAESRKKRPKQRQLWAEHLTRDVTADRVTAVDIQPKAKPVKVSYVYMQQGGSTCEWYTHAHESRAVATAARKDCWKNGSYNTTPIYEMPENATSEQVFVFAEVMAAAVAKIVQSGMDPEPAWNVVAHPLRESETQKQ